MKCIVLAGGRGDRLWPLSRKNYPKQFISLDGSHSIFQDTIARNMAYCDEFVVVTNREYQFIVENQLKVFQGLTWSLQGCDQRSGCAGERRQSCYLRNAGPDGGYPVWLYLLQWKPCGEIRGEAGWSAGAEIPAGFQISD